MSADLAAGAAYEGYIGRWSRVVAREFVRWLDVPAGSLWLDVACGTGALTEAVLASCDPSHVDASDLSATQVAYARRSIVDPRVRFRVGDAREIARETQPYDAVVCGLGFPAIPEPVPILRHLARQTRPGGVIATYVWDFDGEMQMLRHFWEAATALDPAADEPDDGDRFAICKPEHLAATLREAGLQDVTVRAIDAPTRFRDFDDYWTPFLSGKAPAQLHVQSLSDERRATLRERLRATLPFAVDGSLALIARAWAARGRTV